MGGAAAVDRSAAMGSSVATGSKATVGAMGAVEGLAHSPRMVAGEASLTLETPELKAPAWTCGQILFPPCALWLARVPTLARASPAAASYSLSRCCTHPWVPKTSSRPAVLRWAAGWEPLHRRAGRGGAAARGKVGATMVAGMSGSVCTSRGWVGSSSRMAGS